MGFRDDLEGAIYSAACSVMNNSDTAARWGAGAGFAVTGGRGLVGSINLLRTAGTAAGYFCDTPPLPQVPPPYAGGQCATGYTVTWVWDGYYDGNLSAPDSEAGAAFAIGGPIYSITMHPSGGYPVALTLSGEVVLYSNASGGRATFKNLRNIRVTRRDGKPDNCGNPNSVVPPMTPGERERTINVGGVNAQLAIGNGIIQVNGDVTAPIRVNSPDYEFTGELVLNKNEINLNFGGADPNRPCTPETPETDEPPPDDPEPPPEDEDDNYIIGVIVTTTQIGNEAKSTTIWQQENPDIYAPNLGFVSFRLKIKDSYAWSIDFPVKNRRNFIPSPLTFPAVDVAGTPRNGVTWQLTPVKGVQPLVEFS